MAKLLKDFPLNITEYPNVFKRQGAFPLEYYSVFQSISDAKDYAADNPIAYVGQPLAVTYQVKGKTSVDYYIIGDEKGKLIHIGNSEHNLDEINSRLEEIEKFFSLEDGESLKETLDQLIELQKWIEEHLGDFDKFQEETNLALEAEAKTRADEDQRLSNAIGAEQNRAQEAEAALQLSVAQNANLINNEQISREEADAGLLVNINTEKSTRQAQIAELQAALNEEVGRAISKEGQISQDLINATVQINNTVDMRCSLEAETRANAINELKSDMTAKLNAEIASRSESDELLQIKLDDEIVKREEEAETLRTALFEEIDTARAAENELRQKLSTEERKRANEDLAITVSLNNEKQERQQEDARLGELIKQETERANRADKELYDALAAETERANKADDELYQTIEDLTEEDIHLKTDLWTYVNIGKITGASDTSRKKVANRGDSLKTVFDKILGTRADNFVNPVNNSSLSVSGGTTARGGGEFGSSVSAESVTVTFTLSNTGTITYGYRIGETLYKGAQTFYYPVTQYEVAEGVFADIKIELPTEIEKDEEITIDSKTYHRLTTTYNKQTLTIDVVSTLYVAYADNILYCNLNDNKKIGLIINLYADTVETSQQTRYPGITAKMNLGVPQDSQGNNIDAFLTYLESLPEPEDPKIKAVSPSDCKGGEKTKDSTAYTISGGYIPYTYCLSESLPSSLPTTNRTRNLSNSISVSGGNDKTYLYLFVPTSKNDIQAMSAGGFAVPFTKISNSTSYAVNNGEKATYKIFKTDGPVKEDDFTVS